MSDYKPTTEEVLTTYIDGINPAAMSLGEAEETFDRWLAEEMRKARSQGWEHAMTHVGIWIKLNLGKDTLYEFEEDDHPNPYDDKLTGEDDEGD